MPMSKAELDRIVTMLEAVPFCDGLNVEQRTVLAAEMRVRPFVAGETLATSFPFSSIGSAHRSTAAKIVVMPD